MRRTYIFSVGTSVLTNCKNRNIEFYNEIIQKIENFAESVDTEKRSNAEWESQFDRDPEITELLERLLDDLEALRNTKTNEFFLRNSSAEINSLLSIRPRVDAKEHIYLLCTDTVDGYFCGKAVKEFLVSRLYFQNLELIRIQGLKLKNYHLFKYTGLNNLVKKVFQLYYKEKKKNTVILNITGSYKAVSGYLMFIGMLLSVPVQYAYLDEEIVELPRFPIGYSSDVIHEASLWLINRFYEKRKLPLDDWAFIRKQVDYDIDYFVEEIKDNEAYLSEIGSILLADYIESRKNELVTSVFSRESYDKFMQSIFHGSHPVRKRFVVFAILDLDRFKQVNDDYGHLVGDKVLKTFGKILGEKMRGPDAFFCARYGGEEFAVIFEADELNDAKKQLEEIRRRVENRIIKTENGDEIKISVSIGATAVPLIDIKTCKAEEVISKSDENLYKAKDGGRNRVVFDRYMVTKSTY